MNFQRTSKHRDLGIRSSSQAPVSCLLPFKTAGSVALTLVASGHGSHVKHKLMELSGYF
jgi:hypothetical protein